MRTEAQIKANLKAIEETMKGLADQINLVENEYQDNAIHCTGSRCDAFDEILESLKSAKEQLSVLWHMEADLEMEMIYGVDEIQ